jgi:Na+/melibiose symporter-like transporter
MAAHHKKHWGIDTQCVHCGEGTDTDTGAIRRPIHMANSYELPTDIEELLTVFSWDHLDKFQYTREHSATPRYLEERLAALEGGEDCVVTASGMGAVSAVLFTLLNAGAHIVASEVCYTGTQKPLKLGAFAFIACELTLFGIQERHSSRSIKNSPRLRGFFQVSKQVFSDKQVLCFSMTIMLVQLTYQLMLMNVPYFATLILKQNRSAASLLMGIIIIILALSTPMWYWLLSKYPKRHVFRVIMLTMMLGYVLAFFIGNIPVLPLMAQTIVILAIVSIPMGGMFAVALGLIADLTDYDELKFGQRREAVYYGIYGIVRKTGWAACSLIMAAIFSVFGSTAQNPLGVRVIWLVCALACLLGLLVFIPYRIGDSQEETRSILENGSAKCRRVGKSFPQFLTYYCSVITGVTRNPVS